MKQSTEVLQTGVTIVNTVLAADGFRFLLREEGQSKYGPFAWGEFVRDDRRLELHYRHGLGLVRYHVAGHSATHEAYMKALGVWGHHRYPGFARDAQNVFHDLAHDLWYTVDFRRGDAAVLLAAAEKEAHATASTAQRTLARSVGDTDRLEKIRALFKAKHYAEVVKLNSQLQYPELLSETERRMIAVARKRCGS